jgi:hypothetical protein
VKGADNMAATSTKMLTSLNLKIKTGVDVNGLDILKSVTINKVKTDALPQDIYDTAKAFETLYSYPINQILTQDQNVIINA